MGRLISKSPLSNTIFNLDAVNFVNDYKGPRGDYNIEATNVLDESGNIVSQEFNIIDNLGLPDELDIELPEVFGSATNIYHFKVDNDTILFSGDSSTIGLWSYSIKIESWNQIYLEEQ